MEISIKTNFNLNKFDMNNLVEIGLHNSTRRVQSQARENAPYDTGKLKQSIAIEKSAYKARVGPRKLVYAVRREFENNKNPHRKFYMKRAYQDTPKIVQEEFQKAYNIVIKKI